MTTVPVNLYKKIHAIISDNIFVEKKGNNSFHKYKYATEKDILEALRAKFIQHRVIMTLSEENSEQLSVELTKVTYRIRLVDVDSGEFEDYRLSGYGSDKTDKGPWKSLTSVQKYFLAKTFMVATGDDPERDTEDDKPASDVTKPETNSKPAFAPKPAFKPNSSAPKEEFKEETKPKFGPSANKPQFPAKTSFSGGNGKPVAQTPPMPADDGDIEF